MELRKLQEAINKATAAVFNDRRPVTLDADTARLLIEAAEYYHDRQQEELNPAD